MNIKNYTLGTLEASEQLINDLYIELRKKINQWASITNQTAQARMGYIGQHLVSVVTGFPGGKSGARGKDLILPDNEFGEIKTCYRVDQLGRCNSCDTVISPTEETCPNCGSNDIKRNEDSKWLIGIRHEAEFSEILAPKFYFLVLFEFTDINKPTTIRSSIWRVNPTAPGFSYCMIDYYKNIRSQSTSKAPFNLWPYQLKFDLMRPYLIYRSFITPDDRVQTEIFPNRDPERLHNLRPLTEYSRSQNLTRDKIIQFADSMGASVPASDSKSKLLGEIQAYIDSSGIPPEIIIDKLAEALYLPDIRRHLDGLPKAVKERSGIYRV